MGTRADFYVGRGKDAEWLGSIAWDGDECGEAIPKARTVRQYRTRVTTFLKSRDDATFPKDGWPWPWNDSGTTDCAYAFDVGKVWKEYSGKWVGIRYNREDAPKNAMPCVFPKMSARKNVTMGPRSGLIVITA